DLASSPTITAAGIHTPRSFTFLGDETLAVSGGAFSFTNPSSITNGTLNIAGGTMLANAPLAAKNVYLSAGTLGGTGNMTIANLAWSGGTLTDAGPTPITTVNNTLAISGAATKILSLRTLINMGAGTWSGSGNLQIDNAIF